MQQRLPLSRCPAAGAFLRAYADPAQWSSGPMARWFHYSPHDPWCISQRITELKGRAPDPDRAGYAEVIAQQQLLFGSSTAAVDAARRLGQPDTFTVVTGQQAGLFGGPLFTLLKAVGVLKLARRLTTQFPDCTFVPVFWIAGGDSDFEEVRRSTVLNRDGEPVELALPPSSRDDEGLIVAAREVSAAGIAQLLTQLEEVLPSGEFREATLAALREDYSTGMLHHCFARWMAGLFRDTELVFVDPTAPELRTAAGGVIEAQLREQPAAQAALAMRNAELAAAGFPPQVESSEGDTHVFYGERRREKLLLSRDSGALLQLKQSGQAGGNLSDRVEAAPELFSTGALLTPLYQDLLLRPVAFLGGGAELAYRAQSTALFDLHGLKMAPSFLRPTATLLPAKGADMLDALGWELDDLYAPPQQVAARAVAADRPAEIDAALGEYRALLEGADRKLQGLAAGLDPSLNETFETLRGNLLRHVEKLEKKITGALKQRADTRLRKLGLLQNMVYPRGQVQERLLSGLSFLPRYGDGLVARLLESLEVPLWEHQILTLDQEPSP